MKNNNRCHTMYGSLSFRLIFLYAHLNLYLLLSPKMKVCQKLRLIQGRWCKGARGMCDSRSSPEAWNIYDRTPPHTSQSTSKACPPPLLTHFQAFQSTQMPLYLIIGKMIKYFYKKGDNLEPIWFLFQYCKYTDLFLPYTAYWSPFQH